MKKPIDPNLNNIDDEDLLFGMSDYKPKKRGELSFAEGSEVEPNRDDPEFSVLDKKNGQPIDLNNAVQDSINGIVDKSDSSTSSSHHSSSGSHHHSSGSSHHRSSSSSHHHSSSSSHHYSSSNSHRHSSGYSHSSDKKKKKKLPLALRIIIAILAVLMAIILIITGTFFYLRYQGEKNIMPTVTEQTDYDETIEYNGHTYKFNENVFSVAFIGVDQEELKTVDSADFVGAADADIVLTVDKQTGKAKVIAIPRDTMVDIDIYSESNIFLRTQRAQLCLAYSYGDGAEQSCQNSITAMSRILHNVPIQKYFALDLDGIAPLNDAIGGVEISSSLYDFPDLGIKQGDSVTLKGEMAQTYVRTRSLDNINASLNRTDRQVQYIKAYAAQLVPAVMKDFSVISDLYSTAASYSRTNLTLSNATYVASLMLSKGVTSFETYTLKGEMKASDDPILEDVVHAEFTPDEDNLMQTVLDVFYTQID